MSSTTRATALTTEAVEVPRQVIRGEAVEVVLDRFWVAYPAHVAGYGHVGDRIAHATGRGALRRDALASAAGDGRFVDSSARARRAEDQEVEEW